MFWADRIAKNIIDSGLYQPYWVDDMKTPSGRIHVGSLRGVLIHEIVLRALKDAGKKAVFTYVFEDHDPMDELPPFLDRKIWGKYLGQPLFTVPSPEKSASNFADYFAREFQDVFKRTGCTPEIIWMSQIYKAGKMNEKVKLCLDKREVIRKIYEEMYHKKLAGDWYPYQAVCPKCGKESTTKVTGWDGENITFSCRPDAVPWTRGCGYSGVTSPFSSEGNYAGKLPWKVEWPVKWQVIGVTVEGAGKDHMSAGGSHDVAKLICERVLKYQVPYPVAYEFFLIGGKKMSSSKGLGSSSKEVSEIIPPYLLRFLFTRTDYRQTIDFEPMGTMVIPDLFDEYDRCWQAYNNSTDQDLSRTFELSQIDKVPEKNPKLFIPRFRDIANYVQSVPLDQVAAKFEEAKGSKLTPEEAGILKERIDYAAIWIGKYAPTQYRYQLSSIADVETIILTEPQKSFLKKVADNLDKYNSVPELNLALYQWAKDSGMESKSAFMAIYKTLIGKDHGPRAAWLLLSSDRTLVIKRLSGSKEDNGKKTDNKLSISQISKPDFISISPAVKKVYPSVSVGIALIRGVKIGKDNPELEKQKKEFLSSLADLTTEKLGKFPEVTSYRRLYKEMRIDWHSRRPSPEALLRRVALGKELYSVNTCVDAYNLVVMKNRVSVGAFDADRIKFPTVLRFAGEGDEILLLGDKVVTKYTSKELAYYDKIGGYNTDFNYRDAQRTMVTGKTNNLWINVDGVYDITPQQVAESLYESVNIIVKYCGGTVEFAGII